MSGVRAVAFDLYGTLLTLGRNGFARRLPRRMGVRPGDWVRFVRDVLLTTPFATREAFVERALEEFAPEAPPDLREAALGLLEDELSSARLEPGVRPLLRFLDRRGLRLALSSNLASPYREPVERLGLCELFPVAAFSCDEGRAKPDPEWYRELGRRLGVPHEEVLVVGDSLQNDVEPARRLGMRAMRVGRQGPEAAPVTAVGWLTFDGEPAPLLRPGRRVTLGDEEVDVLRLDPVPDEEQGRYNLVWEGRVSGATGAERRFFFKRYLLPESAWVESFTHLLLAELGIETYPVGILDGPEPIFWSAAAPGEKVGDLPGGREVAHEIGRHCASAFLLSNADLRPRNAFLVRGGPPRLVMVDHEHCLFNLALDLHGIEDPCDPRQLRDLGCDELAARVTRRVLSPLAMRRARRTFLETRDASPAIVEAFREGWIAVHSRARRRRGAIEHLLRERAAQEPPLVIGTHGYRRAMVDLDIDDLLARIDAEPAEAVAACL